MAVILARLRRGDFPGVYTSPMQNPKSLSDASLLNLLQSSVAEERKLTTQVLELLREVERRRLFAGQGYGSLFGYAVKGLGYSEASAARRIQAMRLLKDLPELTEKIEHGALNLSTLSAVQCFINREEREQGKSYTVPQKRELLSQMENRSHREVEKILLQTSPASSVPKERIRVITPTETELRLIASGDPMTKLERLKGLLAHAHPHLGFSQLVEILADRALEELDPARKPEPAKKRAPHAAAFTPAPELQPTTSNHAVPAQLPALVRRPSIPTAVRRQVWVRDAGRCTYVAPETGKRCDSQHALEIDHKVPVAKGGTSDLASLRLMCRMHNQWQAILHFGPEKMAQFVPTLK